MLELMLKIVSHVELVLSQKINKNIDYSNKVSDFHLVLFINLVSNSSDLMIKN